MKQKADKTRAKKRAVAYLPLDLHRRLRIISALQDKSISEFLEELITNYLKQEDS